MDKIDSKFDLKFFVPPTLFFSFIFLFNPCFFYYFLKNFDFTLLFVIMIPALGLIFSSLTRFFLNRRSNPIKFNQKDRREATSQKKRQKKEEDNIKNELEEWENLGEKNKVVQRQVLKKWEMATVNFNCCTALSFVFFSGILLLFSDIINWGWYFGGLMIFVIVLFFLFRTNGNKAYKEAFYVDKILKAKKRRGSI